MILLSLRCKKWPKRPNHFISRKLFQKKPTGKPDFCCPLFVEAMYLHSSKNSSRMKLVIIRFIITTLTISKLYLFMDHKRENLIYLENNGGNLALKKWKIPQMTKKT